MADIRRVFIDTSAWIDLMNSNERHHIAAVTFHKSLAPMTLRITSWGIVSETCTWIRYHIGEREASRWLDVKDAMENRDDQFPAHLQGLAALLRLLCGHCLTSKVGDEE